MRSRTPHLPRHRRWPDQSAAARTRARQQRAHEIALPAAGEVPFRPHPHPCPATALGLHPSRVEDKPGHEPKSPADIAGVRRPCSGRRAMLGGARQLRKWDAVMSEQWPSVDYSDWSATCDTLHAHTQVLGKLAVKLAPPEPQLQHAALRITARGWDTAPLPAPDGSGAVVVALDLHGHEAVIEHSAGAATRVPLTPNRPVGDVTRDVLD